MGCGEDEEWPIPRYMGRDSHYAPGTAADCSGFFLLYLLGG